MADDKEETKHNPSDHDLLIVLTNDMKHVSKHIARINETLEKLDDRYVTKVEFDPIQKIVYALVALLLTSMVGAGISLIIQTTP